MLDTPVVMVVFNRPETTRRTLAAVRAAAPTHLLVVADGPRATHPDDDAKCAATRAVFEEVDWPCQVLRHESEQNLGLEANVELGLDWAFEQVEEAIVLEDDCVADPSFFDYTAELLEHYRHEKRVWQISGSSFAVPPPLFDGASYAFTAWASVCGWATWADRWQHHRRMFGREHGAAGDAPVRSPAWVPTPGLLVTPSGRRHFADAAQSDDTITHGWDKHWWLSMLQVGAMALSPSVNMIENIGWGADATHGVVANPIHHATAHRMPFPLRHPDRLAVNVEVERELELILNRVGGRTAVLARRVVKSPALRRLALTVVSSRTTARVMRFGSRLSDRKSRA